MATDIVPAHHAHLDPGADQGASGVTLWGEAGLSECFLCPTAPGLVGPSFLGQEGREDGG
jgi:hypothetical protein